MDVERFVAGIQRQLETSAALGDERTQQIAAALASSITAAARLAILDAISATAAEVSAALLEAGPGPTVTVRLDGSEVHLDLTGAPPAAAEEPRLDDGEATARISLRLSDGLKAEIDKAAAQEGLSVNSWLIRAANAALSTSGQNAASAPGWPGWSVGARHGAQRVTGWVTG
jgi:Ribbon-helix-helix protein, copG family